MGDVELDSKKKFCRFGERENGKLFHFETVKFTRRKKEKSWKDVAGVDATKEENMNS